MVNKLIKYISSRDGWSLAIVGEGPEKENLILESNKLKLQHRVKFYGQVSDKKKWNLLSSSDYLYLPSEFDEITGGYELSLYTHLTLPTILLV